MAKQRVKVREHRPETVSPNNQHEEEDFLRENPLLTSPIMEAGGQVGTPPDEDPFGGNPFGGGGPGGEAGGIGSGEDQTPWWGDMGPKYGQLMGHIDSPYSTTNGFGSGLYGELGPQIQKQAQQMQMLADSKLRSFTPPTLDIQIAGGGIEGQQEAQTDAQQSETLGDQTQADQATPEKAKQEGEKQASKDVKAKDKEKNKKEADQAKKEKEQAAGDAKGKEEGGKDPAAKEGGGKEGAGKEGGGKGKEKGGKGKAAAKGGDAGGGKKVTPNVAGLPGDIAAKLQSVLGMDVSQLKIVSNSSEAVKHGAKAMAKGGNEMHFAPGEFNPNSKEGQFKIGHEGAHLKKQQEGAVKATGEEGGQKVNTDASQEKFADDVGKQMTQDAPAKNNAPTDAPPAPPKGQLKSLGGESVAQFIREGGPDFGGYDNLLNTAEGAKSNAQSSLDGQKTSFQAAVDTEKQNIQSTLEGEAQRAKEIVDGGADKLTEVKDGVVSEVESAGEDKLSNVETSSTTETENVNTMVDGKKDELTSLGDTFGSRLESHAEKEAGRMESETNSNTSEVGNAVSSVKGRFASKEGVDELAGKLENKASDASSKLQEFGSGVASAVRNDGTSNAEKVRTEAQESADALEGAKEKGTEAIDKKKEDADTAISGNTEQFISSAETESESAISQVQQGAGEIESHIMSMGEGVGQQMDQAATEMGTALDTANQEAMTELDTFLNSLADVGWNAELMGQIAGDVSAALAEHQQQMTTFVEENKGKVTQVSGKLKESTGGVVEQVQGEIDKAAQEFKSGLDTKKSEILSENETIASDAATQMASVKTNMEPEISNTVSEAESNWEENVTDVETDMSEKVDDGLEEEQNVVNDFKSEVESSFEELPEKKEDQGLLGAIWDGIKSVASFIGGVFEGFAMAIVKIFTGLWDLLKMLTDPLMLLLAVVAIIVGALILFGIAALAGVTVGTVLLVIGAIFGVGMMAFMFYKAITTEGLSARERGNLVGEGLFEGVTAFLGTGMVARFGKWAGQIGKARHLVNAAGGLPQFMRMAAFVDDIPRLTRLLDAGADMAQLSRLLGNAGDARQAAAILDMVDTVGDMGQVAKLLEYTQDAGRLMNFFKRGIGPGKLLNAVAASGDAGRVLNALDAVGDTKRLVDLLGKSKNVPGILNLIENGGDANKVMDLLESIPNKRQLNALVEAAGGDVNKLESLINGGDAAADAAKVENVVDAGSDAAKVENAVDTGGDAAQVENAVDTTSDAAKVENAVDTTGDAAAVENAVDTTSDAAKVENAVDTTSDATKVENATDTASDAAKVDETTDASKVDDIESGPKPDTLSDANSAAYDRLQNAGLKPRNNGGNVEFLSAEGKVVAEIKDGSLVFKYEGYGGDIVMDPDKTTTFLGKFVESPENPLTGTRYYLGSEQGGIPGLPEGSFSRGAGKAPNNNGLNSLDIPEDEYMRIINKHLDEQRNLPENAGLSPKELEAKGWEAGNNEFWDSYNEPFLEDAFARGDNIRLISDPATQNTGTYARELAAIQGPNGLAAKYGYVWDPSLSSYVKGGGNGNPGVLDNVLGASGDAAKIENVVDGAGDAAKVENAVDGAGDAAAVENAVDGGSDAAKMDGSSNPNNTNTNGGVEDANPGGGMMGADVYGKAGKKSGDRISNMGGYADYSKAIDDVLQSHDLPHGATVHRPKAINFQMQVDGQDVDIVMKYHSSNGAWADATKTSVHGADNTGLAMNKVTYDSTTGKFSAEVHIHLHGNQADLDKMAVHEFSEVADIVHTQAGKLSGGAVIDDAKMAQDITALQEASVFKDGINVSDIKAANLSAHDRSAARELQMVIEEVNTYMNATDSARGAMRDPRETLQKLLKSMGINDMGDPRVKLLKDELGVSIPSNVDDFLYTQMTPLARVPTTSALEAQALHVYNTHVKIYDGITGTGVSGCHDDKLFKSLKGTIWEYADGVTGPTAGQHPGLLEYSYKLIRQDGSGTTAAQVYTKTTFGPGWTDQEIITSTAQAFDNAISSGGLNVAGSRTWTGVDAKGRTVSGFFEGGTSNPTMTTFWFGNHTP